MEWDNERFLIVKRIKKGFFEFWCNKCDHSWSTHYGTFKFYIAFKKDKNLFCLNVSKTKKQVLVK